MSIPVRSGNAPGVPMPAGMNPSVVTEIRDMGEQPDRFNPGKMRRTVLVVFKNAAGQEAARFYTPSTHPKANLGKDVRAVNNGEVPPEFKDMAQEWPAGLKSMQCLLLTKLGTNAKGYPTAEIQAVLPAQPGQAVVPAAVAAAAPIPQAAPAAPPPAAAAVPATSAVGF